MRKLLRRALAVVPILLLVSAFAYGTTTSITLCESGTCSSVASGTSAAVFVGTYGSYTLNIATGTNDGFNLLASDTSTGNTSPGTGLYIFVTGTDYSTITKMLLSQYSGNALSGTNSTLSATTYYDNSNGAATCDINNLSGCGTALHTFGPFTGTNINTGTGLQSLDAASLTNPYAMTIEFYLNLGTASGLNPAHAGMNGQITPIPEPASLLLMGTGFLALGSTFRRKLMKK